MVLLLLLNSYDPIKYYYPMDVIIPARDWFGYVRVLLFVEVEE